MAVEIYVEKSAMAAGLLGSRDKTGYSQSFAAYNSFKNSQLHYWPDSRPKFPKDHRLNDLSMS